MVANGKWTEIKGSFWFLPAVLVLLGGLAALSLTWLDRAFAPQIQEWAPWLFEGTASSGRGLLSAIAASLITVVSISFSVTIVALQQASTQYSPRVIRLFLRDRGYQAVLGSYVATFAFSLLVLRTIRDPEEGGAGFLPSLSITVALALALACLGLLIYFITRITDTIQAAVIIKKIHTTFLEGIGKIFPDEIGEAYEDAPPAAELVDSLRGRLRVVEIRSSEAGFVTAVDEEGLRSADLRAAWVHFRPKMGDFVSRGEVLAELGDCRGSSDEASARIRTAVVIGSQRTIDHDALYNVRQLADVALKALSPSVNDSTTAEYCINYLKDGLADLAGREFPAPARTVSGSDVVFIFSRATWRDFVDLSFEQVIDQAKGNPYITRKIIECIDYLLGKQILPSRREPLLYWRERALRNIKN